MVQTTPEGVKAATRAARAGTVSLRWRRRGLWTGFALFLLFAFAPFPGIEPATQRTAGLALIMSVWWMTEAAPIPVTALLPLVLLPILGVLSPADAAEPYANSVIFLFLGGFVLALSMERWHLHRRLALRIVAFAGTRPTSLVFGFMCATAFISMWVSNTATTAMMAPIAIALAELLRPKDPDVPFPFATALLLATGYAATVGGVSTIIGTPPNAVFAGAAREILGRNIGFGEWMVVGVPVMLVMLPVTWALLVFVLHRPGTLPPGADQLIAAERAELGPMQRGEKITMAVFVTMAAAWILREPKDLGTFTIPGIATFLPGIDDSTIAIAGAIALFLIPVDVREGKYTMEWSEMRRLPWGVLLLFGGGLSLARSFEVSGLTTLIGQAVAGLSSLPHILLLGVVAAIFVYFSELASNLAIAAMAMPILAAAARGLGLDPIPFMATGVLAASCAFMLPVGTPPNAIVFGSGHVGMTDMVKAGFWLNLVSIVVMTLAGYLLAGPFLGN